ncbi:Classical arabinogalactan protein [Actinidia chinensis var. chinensis]|uniref:Classical arabinogalactan protein n=1 Tax=Actinidia chinensis var. chinensis TaxID=1590841 RepID=A0A2R6R6A3_ACTCC|nr:Classical arabinogalactan protein [Actinidia chinensis var. chinensis]
MFDFGDELVFGSQRIPWLLWIQILVLLLLVILLYYLIIFALGLDLSANAAAADSPSSANAASTSRFHDAKVGEIQCIEHDEGTSTQIRKVRREDLRERLGRSYHPCHYFGLAKQAFLKCLGLDLSSKDSPKEE